MIMFETFLSSIPKNRSEMVNELEIPNDITVSPYYWEPDDTSTVRSDSTLSGGSISFDDRDLGTVSTASSIALSRAMTDSEIDYGQSTRYKSRCFSDPWMQMKAALEAFPCDYLSSLNSFQNSCSEITEECSDSECIRQYNDELRMKMERFFDEECRVFTPDDPGLLALEEALENIDLNNVDIELDSTIQLQDDVWHRV